uniref:Uncharacterized protein n=1 Tax=Rhizophora mucronata TaxID=61149 RepID=A0A2P2NDH4_RHIMU
MQCCTSFSTCHRLLVADQRDSIQ